jgi:bisphosphoglycerate-independent phosphoglycerate mutase (AlkP superfamily)
MIKEHHPRLAIINFSETDKAGHAGKWDDYLATLKRADSLIVELWRCLDSDPVYAHRATLIVTNDHGRHTADFKNHGDFCEGCRHLMCLVVGPYTPAGVVDSVRCRQVDIAPTVGALLGFTTPLSIGDTMQTVLRGN